MHIDSYTCWGEGVEEEEELITLSDPGSIIYFIPLLIKLLLYPISFDLEVFNNVAANGNIRTGLGIVGPAAAAAARPGNCRSRTGGLSAILDEPLEDGQHVERVLGALLAQEILLAL